MLRCAGSWLRRSGPNGRLRRGRDAGLKPSTPRLSTTHYPVDPCILLGTVTPPGGSPASYLAGASEARIGASSTSARRARPVRLGASFEGVKVLPSFTKSLHDVVYKNRTYTLFSALCVDTQYSTHALKLSSLKTKAPRNEPHKTTRAPAPW